MRKVFTIMKTQGMKALLLALLLSAAGLAKAQIYHDFEDGLLPEGWTYHSHFTSSWYVGEQDPQGSTQAYDGNYSLFIGGTNLYGRDYIVSPPIEFFGDENNRLEFAWCTPSWVGQNELTVYYGTDPNDPSEWIACSDFSMMQSEDWTGAFVDLGKLYGTYHIIFLSHDNYGYCTGLDNISIFSFFTVGDLIFAVNEDNVSVTLCGHVDGHSATGALNIPETVTFNGHTFTVTRIGYMAFYGCHGLTGNLVIPNSVTYIGEDAFSDCDGFTGSLTIPNSVTALGSYPFWGCSGFTGRLTIGNSLIEIPYSAFCECTGFTELVIGESVNYIAMQAFCGCNGLTAIQVLPKTPPIMHDYVFLGFNNYSIPVTVPYGTINAYRNAPVWNEFTNFIEAPNNNLITEIYIDGFTPPVWGAHPDLDLTVPPDAHYSIYKTAWAYEGVIMNNTPEIVFDKEGTYCMGVILDPADGYSFDENATVYINGDASLCNAALNELNIGNYFITYTIDFELTNVVQYAITTGVNPPAGGTVTGGGTYKKGDICTLTAVPKSGYGFVSWSDGSTENPYSFVVTGNANFVANFKSLGVGEIDETALSIYPNPAKESIRIEGLEADNEVQIYNSLGMLVKTVNAIIDEEINVSDLKAGIYMIRCGRQILRFVKM